MKEIAEYLESMRWCVQREHNETWYLSPDGQQAICLGEWWELRSFTDSDMDTECGPVAVGRYVMDAEGSTLAELREAMQEVAL